MSDVEYEIEIPDDKQEGNLYYFNFFYSFTVLINYFIFILRQNTFCMIKDSIHLFLASFFS